MEFKIENGVLLKYEGREKEIVVPDGVESIAREAFSNCKTFTSISFPSSLRSIGIYAFGHCQSLTEIIIPDSVTNIEMSAFAGCENLETIKLSSNLSEIKQSTFSYCKKITDVDIPTNIKHIGARAFENCENLRKIVIHETVESIGEYAFAWCKSLKEISISPEKTKIDKEAFNLCYNVERYNIPGGVKTTEKLPTSLLNIYYLKFDPEEMAWIGLYQGDKKWKEWFYDKMDDGGSKLINTVAIKMADVLNSNGKIPKAVQNRVADFMTKYKKKIKPENAQKIQECFGEATATVQKAPKKEPKQLGVSEIIQKNKTRSTAWFEKRSISPDSFSGVKLTEGADVSATDAAMFVMYEYGRQMQKDPAYHAKTYKSDYVEVKLSEDAEIIAALLDKESLKEAIKQNTPVLTVLLQNDYWSDEDPDKDFPELYPGGPRMLKYILNAEPFTLTPKQIEEEHKNMYTFSWGSSWGKPSVSGLEYFLPYARFAGSEEVRNLINTAENLMKNWVIPGRTAAIAIRSALLLNDTKEAIDYLDKYGMLSVYAKMRGKTVSALRSKKSKTSLKADGTMSFDL